MAIYLASPAPQFFPKKRVYTHYQDGVTWLDGRCHHGRGSSDTYVDISYWQWWLYSLFLWADRKVQRWCVNLDNQAYHEMEVRQGKVR